MPEINIDWKDIEPKLEEQAFKDANAAKSKKATGGAGAGGTGDGKKEDSKKEESTDSMESFGLADMIAESWNDVAIPKGYDGVTETQKTFLTKHTIKLENKIIKAINLVPEVEASLAHVIVYLPKWVKKKKADMDKDKADGKTKK